MTDVEFTNLKSRLTGLAGSAIPADQLPKLIKDILKGGGGVRIELDAQRLKLILRDGRFVLKREERPSVRPPPRPPSKPPYR